MKYTLRLYVSGSTSTSLRAIANLRAIGAAPSIDEFDIEVIDILEHPALAEDGKILATPTLVRVFPEPVRKVIGDLGDRARVLTGLDIRPGGSPEGTIS